VTLRFDTLVLGSGIAGLSYALKMARHGTVALVTKRSREDSNTRLAQGGIAAVMGPGDSFEAHVVDTIQAGDGLNHPDIVRLCVEHGPARLAELIELGVAFTRVGGGAQGELDLTREGGHSSHRVVHARDMTGAAVSAALLAAVAKHPGIQVFEEHHAVDLITRRRLGLPGGDRCLGAYVLDVATGGVKTILGRVVMLATGGAGKVYRYTSNPDLATGDGMAMGWRAGTRIANMEFFQFHPTCLFHPKAKNFLVTEACRGEGGILRTLDGAPFMKRYHEHADLAPRDVVARAIDNELKRRGDAYVVLDLTHLPAALVKERFPGVDAKLTSLGIDMTQEPIQVVPAAHYCCGGVQTDGFGRTAIDGLLAAGEVAHTGLHGANRLASNSLLEGLVFAHRAAEISPEVLAQGRTDFTPEVPDWKLGFAIPGDQNVLVAHAWDEIRQLMWNYVGIARSNKRLIRAQRRLDVLYHEIKEDYWSYHLTPDLIELRNICTVAQLIVECALIRKESRGLHQNVDYPDRDDAQWLRDTVLRKGRFT
jgi:L-aspartate oxidase